MFVNLLTLMMVADIDYLNKKTIDVMIQRLFLHNSEEEAAAEFKKLIKQALACDYRRWDNGFHLLNDWCKKAK